MKHYATLIHQCDLDIKEGRPQDVGRHLATCNPARVPREWRRPLAKICRRAGLLQLGLKVLAPVISTDSLDVVATPAELAEYSVLLQRSGALREALEKLNRVDIHIVPEALLYRAYIHFAQWEFSQAIPHLQKYLLADLKPHAKSVGQLNLAFALIESQRSDDAMNILENLGTLESPQMRSNRHALVGQILLQQDEFATARKEFNKARDLVSSSQTNDQFFALKWSLILDGLESKDISAFDRLRTLAIRNRSWEGCREADLYSLKANFEHERFLYLYSGSPYQGFHDRVHAELKVIPAESIYILGEKSAPCMDLKSGLINNHEPLTAGRKGHQLIALLLHDFYRPMRIAGIFSALFPGEYFDVSTSPHRVHQLISRTRHRLKKEGIPISIVETEGFYSLNIDGPFSIAIPIQRQAVDLPQLQLEKLKSSFGYNPFSVDDAAKSLCLSPATAYRLIRRGLKEQKIERLVTQMRAALFKIPVAPQKKIA